MKERLEKEIDRESRKRLAEYSKNCYINKKQQKLFEKRTGLASKSTPTLVPSSWQAHKHFDPRYTKKNKEFLAAGIWHSILTDSYEPVPAIRHLLPKDDGSQRSIDVFSIPDAAVARLFFFKLRDRNSKIFAQSSYAYQRDKTALDAIIRLSSLLDNPKTFVTQYDFRAFFDSVPHEYIFQILEESRTFLTTFRERQILRAIATHKHATPHAYGSRTFGKRERGIPQGNSLSLFLANVAAHHLDTELDRVNGAFARFADDVVVVNYRYEDAQRTAEIFRDFSDQSGILINEKKSPGIRLFGETYPEIGGIESFKFLGYKFTPSGTTVSQTRIKSIKKRCSYIIYNNLLYYPRTAPKFNTKRIGKNYFDWDLVQCINELRRYIYGRISQKKMDSYLRDEIEIQKISGVCSYFCVISDPSIFRELDGWLLNVLMRAYKERCRILSHKKKMRIPTRQEFLDGSWYKYKVIEHETRLPSFYSAWRAARKSWERSGDVGVHVPSGSYGYDE